MHKYEIVVAGVGGQGVIFISNVLGYAAQRAGYRRVVGGEIHGLAQRGGSVASYVRFGEGVYGPIVPLGCADIIIGLEFMEGLRHINRLSKNGVLVLSNVRVPTMGMMVNNIAYPTSVDVLSKLQKLFDRVFLFESGNTRDHFRSLGLENMILLGAIVNNVLDFPIGEEDIKESIKTLIKKSMVERNLEAFQVGMKLRPLLT
jgi:indolepyruvate ferredoxin oxidoreductase beta subunit